MKCKHQYCIRGGLRGEKGYCRLCIDSPVKRCDYCNEGIKQTQESKGGET